MVPDSHDAGAGVGVWTSALDRLAPRDAQRAAADIEELGYRSPWFGESVGREAFTNAGLLLSGTERITVATGIATIYGRDPMAAAAAAKTLHAASGGRFLAGLGVSHRTSAERRGQAYGPPLSAMRESCRPGRDGCGRRLPRRRR